MSSTTSERKLYAVLAHVLAIFFSFVAPLVILLVTEDKIVKNHARNSLNFQITLIIGWVVATVLAIILIGLILYPVLFVASIVLPIMAAVKSSNEPNTIWKYPLSIQFLKLEDADVVDTKVEVTATDTQVQTEKTSEPVTKE